MTIIRRRETDITTKVRDNLKFVNESDRSSNMSTPSYDYLPDPRTRSALRQE